MAANVNYGPGNLRGRNALEIAYTYGRDAADTRWAKSQLGGTLTEQSLTGGGETIYKGTLRNANDAGSQVIELNAAATGTTAVLKNVLQNGAGQADSRVRAYVDTETALSSLGQYTGIRSARCCTRTTTGTTHWTAREPRPCRTMPCCIWPGAAALRPWTR